MFHAIGVHEEREGGRESGAEVGTEYRGSN